jgi:hypothetical protein
MFLFYIPMSIVNNRVLQNSSVSISNQPKIVILKHIKRNKKCRPSYTEEDIECLEKQAAERKKEKRNIRKT